MNLDSHYEIGSSVTNEIPGVAYTVPDVDARVRVLIYDLKSYKELACVEAILSNGKTVQTKYAGWPIAAISGLGVLFQSLVIQVLLPTLHPTQCHFSFISNHWQLWP